MASSSLTGPVALLAIKPRFAEAIIAGRKTVEFRRTRFSRLPTHIILYASSPIKKVVAYCEVVSIRELTPAGLWREFRAEGGIDHTEFREYYKGARIGIAIVITNVSILRGPASLGRVAPQTTPPQSFRYLDTSLMVRLATRTVREKKRTIA
jgi:predicted transcriptional regulator